MTTRETEQMSNTIARQIANATVASLSHVLPSNIDRVRFNVIAGQTGDYLTTLTSKLNEEGFIEEDVSITPLANPGQTRLLRFQLPDDESVAAYELEALRQAYDDAEQQYNEAFGESSTEEEVPAEPVVQPEPSPEPVSDEVITDEELEECYSHDFVPVDTLGIPLAEDYDALDEQEEFVRDQEDAELRAAQAERDAMLQLAEDEDTTNLI